MKNISKVVLCILTSIPFTMMAQSIDPIVEVSSQYKVDMGEIHKPSIDLSVNDSLQRFDINFDYSIYDRPYQNLYVFAPYSYTQIKHPQELGNNILFANIGYQSVASPIGHIAVQAITKKSFAAGVYGNFDGYYKYGDVEVDDITPNFFRQRYKTDFGANMKYAWRSGEVDFDANYRIFDDKFVYTSNHSDKLSFTATLNSANVDEKSVDYGFVANFYHLNANHTNYSKIGESMFSVKGDVGTTFDIHRVFVDVNVQMASYSDYRSHEAWILEFAPIYEYNKGRLFGRFGAKFGSRFASKVKNNESGVDHKDNLTNIFPVVDAKYTLINNHLWVHAIATGSNHMNSLESMITQCPIVKLSSPMEFGHTPIDAQLSLESTIGGVFAINIDGGYSINRNTMVIGTSATELVPIASYFDYEHLRAGADMLLKIDHFSIGGNVSLNKYIDWFEETQLNILPKLIAHASAAWDLRERLFVSVKCDYSSESDFLPQMVNLGTEISLVLNRHFEVFVKGDNLLNQDLYYAPLYCGRERNFGGGLTVNF